MTFENLILTILTGLVIGMITSGFVSEYYRRLYMIKEAVNYAKETELYFNEIQFEALKYSQNGNDDKLQYLLHSKEIYRKDVFDINDKYLQDAIGRCNEKIYDLSKIVTDTSINFERKAFKIKDFDFATPLIEINNSRISYEVKAYKKAKCFRNSIVIISFLILLGLIIFYYSIGTSRSEGCLQRMANTLHV